MGHRPRAADRCWLGPDEGGNVVKRVLAIVVVSALVVPAHAQIVVIDPSNLTQAILIAERTLREYETLWAQYQTILRMSQKLGNMDRFRTPPIAFTRHDPSRRVYRALAFRVDKRRVDNGTPALSGPRARLPNIPPPHRKTAL